jgi:hypothetical protein
MTTRIPFDGMPPEVRAGEPVHVRSYTGDWMPMVALGPARYDETRATAEVRLTVPVASVVDWMENGDRCRIVNWPAEDVRRA